jgi:hypothetical protein
MYHSAVMQRPEEEDDDPRRERMNGASSSNTRPYHAPQPGPAPSPTQTDFHSPYSPTNGSHPRPQFNNPYHPPTPAPLPMPTATHVPGPPASPRTLTAPSAYQSDYQPAPRDKPTSNYYDPTSDSSERRPSESAGWNEGHTPQVPALHEGPNSENFTNVILPDSRVLHLSTSFCRATKILQRSIHLSCRCHLSPALTYFTLTPSRARLLDITITKDGFNDLTKYAT